MIELRTLRRVELLEFINSDEFKTAAVIPITKQRAISQRNNPRCEETDVLLILVYSETTLVGYAGMLPDKIFSAEGREEKFAWLSGLWVSEKARGQGLGVQLIKKALECYDQKLLSADYVPFTKKLYDRSEGFLKEPYERKGIRLYVKADFTNLLQPKHSIFSNIKFLLKPMDGLFNIFLNTTSFFSNYKLGPDQMKIIETKDWAIAINSFPSVDNSFKRNAIELKWMLEFPWIKSDAEAKRAAKQYHFSSYADQFDNKIVQILDSTNHATATLFFTIRNQNLKLTYLFHQENWNMIIQIINHLLIKWNIKSFTCFHAVLSKKLAEAKTPAFLKRTLTRKYMIGKALSHIVKENDFDLQDGDGDCGFT